MIHLDLIDVSFVQNGYEDMSEIMIRPCKARTRNRCPSMSNPGEIRINVSTRTSSPVPLAPHKALIQHGVAFDMNIRISASDLLHLPSDLLA